MIEKPITSTPEFWYMAWNGSLVVGAIGLFWILAWWLLPGIIARGIERWFAEMR